MVPTHSSLLTMYHSDDVAHLSGSNEALPLLTPASPAATTVLKRQRS